MANDYIKVIATNKKARRNYEILDEYEAGIVLVGTEVKSIRSGKVNFQDAYAEYKNNEIFLRQLHINPYKQTHYGNHEPLRSRKLLLNRYEIKRLSKKVLERGLTLIPIQIYFKNNKIKVKLGLAKGKKLYDKREDIKRRDIKRDMDRERKNN